MDRIIQSTLNTLNKTHYIISFLNDEQFKDASVKPYCSSIGSHIRHILDFYDCILNLDLDNKVDLTSRKRDLGVESQCDSAIQYCDDIIKRLGHIDRHVNYPVIVIDDLGLGKLEIEYTLGALFSQANSHTIHHYAIINYIMHELKIEVPDMEFGYNPTTPKRKVG